MDYLLCSDNGQWTMVMVNHHKIIYFNNITILLLILMPMSMHQSNRSQAKGQSNNKHIFQLESFHTQGHVVSKFQFQSKVSSIKNQQNTNRPPLPKKTKRTILKQHYVCDQRRQNQLNAKFLKKKQNLQIITKQNQHIYKRINSQKSVYSHRSLNKSYESNRSLMNSRDTNRSNKSFKKFQVKKISKNNLNQKSENKNIKIRINSAKSLKNQQKTRFNDSDSNFTIGINSRNITKVDNQDLKQFAYLFRISQQAKPSHMPKMRSRSVKIITPILSKQCSSSALRPLIQTKINQIVINQQNQIEFVQEKRMKFQKEKKRSSTMRNTNLKKNGKSNNQNVNLFQIKTYNKTTNDYLCKKLQQKFKGQSDSDGKNKDKFSQIKISKKYSGLMTRIADQLIKIKKLQPRLLQISGKQSKNSIKQTKTHIF